MPERTCNNCYASKCSNKKVNGVCKDHYSLEERIYSVFKGSMEEWRRFSNEWDEARYKLRRLGGLE